MESEHVKVSNEPVKKTPEIKHEDETPFTEGRNREVSSHSSSSLEVYIDEKGHLHNSSVKPQSDGNLSSSSESIPSPDVTTQTGQLSIVSASPFAENGVQKSSPEPFEMKSPQVQTMGQPPGYDPNRIPASIFSTKTGNPTEWSATSNESLFSIHMGNNSFSRDYAILFGKSGELPRLEDWNNSQSNPFAMSGELPRLEEWNNSQSNFRYVSEAKTNEFGSLPASLPPVMEVPSQEESGVQSGDFSRKEKKDDDKSLKAASVQTTENHGKENHVPAKAVNLPAAAAATRPDVKKPPIPETNYLTPSSNPVSFPSPPRLSDASGHSGSSFAFPV